MAQIYDSRHSGQEVDKAVDAVQTTIPNQLTQIGLKLGDLTQLQTSAKTSAVAAINEVNSNLDNLESKVSSIGDDNVLIGSVIRTDSGGSRQEEKFDIVAGTEYTITNSNNASVAAFLKFYDVNDTVIGGTQSVSPGNSLTQVAPDNAVSLGIISFGAINVDITTPGKIRQLKEEIDQEISQLDKKVTYLTSAPITFSESATFTSEFYAYEGDVIIVDITAISANYSLFTIGFSSDVYVNLNSNSIGKTEITILHNGYLRFYRSSASGTIEGSLALKSYLSEQFDSLNEDIAELNANLDVPSVPSLGSIAITTLKVEDSVTFTFGKRYVFDDNATIYNYTNYEQSSSVQAVTAPIRIRSNGGMLIYSNLRLKSASVPSGGETATCAMFFGKDGKYLRYISYAKYVERETPILSDEYYAIFSQFPTQSGYADAIWIIDPVNINWLNAGRVIEKYYVGAGKDFTTVTAMLTALQNNENEKIVYIDAGEYDIFEEMGGAEYMASLAETAASLNWRDVCHVVPPNTTIIGIGNVVIKWLPTAAQMVNGTVAFLFSPLNLSGTCTIENITILAQNCRYAVHDETSGRAEYNGAIHKFINCRLEHRQSSIGHYLAYGAGHNKLMTLSFKDCYFYSYRTTPWSTHDQGGGINENSNFVFDNCIFESGGSECLVRFSTSDTVGRQDKVQMNNCYIGATAKISFSVESSTTNRMQGYVVTMVGCSQAVVEHAEAITTTYDTHQYLPQ